MQSAESNRQPQSSNVDPNHLELNRFHLAPQLDGRRQFLPNLPIDELNHSTIDRSSSGQSSRTHSSLSNVSHLTSHLPGHLASNQSSHNQSYLSSLTNPSLSNYQTSSFSCPTADQLRHRSLGYNCITTNFNNGPITSSYVNQANYNYNNKFNSFNQVF